MCGVQKWSDHAPVQLDLDGVPSHDSDALPSPCVLCSRHPERFDLPGQQNLRAMFGAAKVAAARAPLAPPPSAPADLDVPEASLSGAPELDAAATAPEPAPPEASDPDPGLQHGSNESIAGASAAVVEAAASAEKQRSPPAKRKAPEPKGARQQKQAKAGKAAAQGQKAMTKFFAPRKS